MDRPTTTFFDLVLADLDEVESRMRVSSAEHHVSLAYAIDHLLSSGGKRIRPTLVLLICGMLGADRDAAINLAASIEMLHTATLVHDDLIDGSLLRRGLPTLNTKWSPSATVLTGDFIFARAAQLAAEVGEQKLMKIFARGLMTIVNGEIAQMFGEDGSDGHEEYFERIYAKTASLFEIAAEGSALISGCDESTLASMKHFGYNIGMAFQIVDDVLDFIGEQERVGKPVANDLRQGLITLPTLCYLEGHENGTDLLEDLKHTRVGEADLEALIQSIRSSGAIDHALDEARVYILEAEGALHGAPASPEREALFDLARYIAYRNQ